MSFPASPGTPMLHWFKGNLHTHTTSSDGDSPLGEVARWYRDHEYDFLVLTDHNVHGSVEEMQREIDLENEQRNRKPFLLIPGEEVSDLFHDEETPRIHPVHVGALGSNRLVGVQGGESPGEMLQRCVDAVHAAGGLPCVNHPNFNWALTTEDLFAVKNVDHFEIYNGHPTVHNIGGSGKPGCEAIWDALLTRGRHYYGLAADDAHHFHWWESGAANPGRGWIVVRAAEPTRDAILKAIRSGELYCSTGVELDDATTDDSTLHLQIHRLGDFAYRTEFIGRDGAVLAVDETLAPSYSLKPDDLYVRARVTDSGGRHAWTQPLFPPGATNE